MRQIGYRPGSDPSSPRCEPQDASRCEGQILERAFHDAVVTITFEEQGGKVKPSLRMLFEKSADRGEAARPHTIISFPEGSMNNNSLAARWRAATPHLLSVLRIFAAFLFLQFGTAKLFAFPAAIMPDGGTAPLASLAGIAGLLEFVGGTLLLVGLFTRPVAFLLSGQMAVAYFLGHAGNGFWPVLNGGSPAVMFCFVWLYLSAAGPGPWSLDALRGRSAGGA